MIKATVLSSVNVNILVVRIAVKNQRDDIKSYHRRFTKRSKQSFLNF